MRREAASFFGSPMICYALWAMPAADGRWKRMASVELEQLVEALDPS